MQRKVFSYPFSPDFAPKHTVFLLARCRYAATKVFVSSDQSPCDSEANPLCLGFSLKFSAWKSRCLLFRKKERVLGKSLLG